LRTQIGSKPLAPPLCIVPIRASRPHSPLAVFGKYPLFILPLAVFGKGEPEGDASESSSAGKNPPPTPPSSLARARGRENPTISSGACDIFLAFWRDGRISRALRPTLRKNFLPVKTRHSCG